jgi:hypothetical protein
MDVPLILLRLLIDVHGSTQLILDEIIYTRSKYFQRKIAVLNLIYLPYARHHKPLSFISRGF